MFYSLPFLNWLNSKYIPSLSADIHFAKWVSVKFGNQWGLQWGQNIQQPPAWVFLTHTHIPHRDAIILHLWWWSHLGKFMFFECHALMAFFSSISWWKPLPSITHTKRGLATSSDWSAESGGLANPVAEVSNHENSSCRKVGRRLASKIGDLP